MSKKCHQWTVKWTKQVSDLHLWYDCTSSYRWERKPQDAVSLYWMSRDGCGAACLPMAHNGCFKGGNELWEDESCPAVFLMNILSLTRYHEHVQLLFFNKIQSWKTLQIPPLLQNQNQNPRVSVLSKMELQRFLLPHVSHWAGPRGTEGAGTVDTKIQARATRWQSLPDLPDTGVFICADFILMSF